mgnify:CR=1 FL=1
MICIKVNIPQELCEIDDELKAIYHSKDTICFFIFKTRDERNEFMEKTQGMEKGVREQVYKKYT